MCLVSSRVGGNNSFGEQTPIFFNIQDQHLHPVFEVVQVFDASPADTGVLIDGKLDLLVPGRDRQMAASGRLDSTAYPL